MRIKLSVILIVDEEKVPMAPELYDEGEEVDLSLIEGLVLNSILDGVAGKELRLASGSQVRVMAKDVGPDTNFEREYFE